MVLRWFGGGRGKDTHIFNISEEDVVLQYWMTIILADVRQKNIRRRGMSQNPFYINKSSSQSLRVFLEAPFSWNLLKIGSDSVRGIIKKSSSYKYVY